MDFLDSFFLALIGIVAGFFGGLLGIGGGSITLPLLFFVLLPLGVPDNDLMHIVLGTTFAAMFLNTAASSYFQNKRGNIPWHSALVLLPSVILGPIAGSYVATSLEGPILRFSFGIFQILTAVYFLLPRHKRVEVIDKRPHPVLSNIVAFVIGGIGSILGIGGGIIMVPFLDMMGMHIKKAIGLSSFTSCVMLFSSAVSFLVLGLANPLSIPNHIGFIYIPAFLIVGLFSMISAPLGVRLVNTMPIVPLKRVFAFVLATLGVLLILDK